MLNTSWHMDSEKNNKMLPKVI